MKAGRKEGGKVGRKDTSRDEVRAAASVGAEEELPICTSVVFVLARAIIRT